MSLFRRKRKTLGLISSTKEQWIQNHFSFQVIIWHMLSYTPRTTCPGTIRPTKGQAFSQSHEDIISVEVNGSSKLSASCVNKNPSTRHKKPPLESEQCNMFVQSIDYCYCPWLFLRSWKQTPLLLQTPQTMDTGLRRFELGLTWKSPSYGLAFTVPESSK